MSGAPPTTSRFGTQTAVLLVGRILAYGLTMAIPFVLVRAMTPDLFGTYKQLFLVFATLWAALQAGLAESLYYFFPEEPRAKGAYVMHSLLVFGVLGGVACLILVAGREVFAAALHNPGLASYLPLLGIYLWLMLPSCVLETLMIVERKAVSAALAMAGLEAVKMAAVVVPALAGAGLTGILWGSVLHAVLRLVVMAWYLRRAAWPLAGLSWETMRRHWRYATPLGGAALIGLIQVSADQYVVSSRYEAAVFAVYAVGLFQLPIVALVGTVTASTFMVELADLRKTGGHAPLDLWHRVTTRLAALCFPVFAFSVVWASDLITVLFTDTYRASIPIFQVVSCGALLAPLLTDAVLRVYADTPWILRVNAIKLVVTAILVPAAVAWGSLAGVALVGVLITMAGKGLMLKRIAERFHVRGAVLLPWSALASVGAEAAVCLVPAVWASRAWGASPGERLVIGLVVYGVAYAAVLATDRAVRGLGCAVRVVASPSLPNEREAP